MLKPFLLLPVVAMLLIGCSKENQTQMEEAASSPQSTEVTPRPSSVEPSTLALVRDGNRIALGDSLPKVFQVFSKPKPSFEFTDLPPGFQSPYSAKGWETAREGVGAILYGDKVVAIMRELQHASPDTLQEMVDTITKANAAYKPSIVQGSHVTYYFWVLPKQCLMISALQTGRNLLSVTEALGDTVVMDSLGLSPAQARDDQPKVDQFFQKGKS